MGSEDGNSEPMTRAECGRVSGKINLALFGVNNRGGMQADITKILEKASWLEREVKKNAALNIEEKKLAVTRYGIMLSFIAGLIGAGVALIIAFWSR